MPAKDGRPGPGDRWLYCAIGVLTDSPSGNHLMCEECDRIIVCGELKTESQWGS